MRLMSAIREKIPARNVGSGQRRSLPVSEVTVVSPDRDAYGDGAPFFGSTAPNLSSASGTSRRSASQPFSTFIGLSEAGMLQAAHFGRVLSAGGRGAGAGGFTVSLRCYGCTARREDCMVADIGLSPPRSACEGGNATKQSSLGVIHERQRHSRTDLGAGSCNPWPTFVAHATWPGQVRPHPRRCSGACSSSSIVPRFHGPWLSASGTVAARGAGRRRPVRTPFRPF
jgi:hypothetical protein